MDDQELNDWRDFCEGRKACRPMMFSNMFMGMFYDLNEKNKNDLRTVFSYIPNSSRTLGKLLRIGTPPVDISEQRITELVIQDLNEMRRVVDELEIVTAMDFGVSEIISDERRFRKVFEAPLNVEFIDCLTDYFAEKISLQDDKIRALDNAFYGIASNIHLQLALTADLLDDASFDNYFELYLIGVDYALDTNGALVINYRE